MEDYRMIKNYSTTRQRKVMFEWKIDQFYSIMKCSMYNKDDGTIESNYFSTHETENPNSWSLTVRFNNDEKSVDKEWVSILITYFGKRLTTKVKCSLFIFNNEKEKKFENKLYKFLEKGKSWCIPKFLEVNQLLEKKDTLLPDNALTICIKLTEFVECHYLKSPIIKIPLKTSNHQIAHDLKDLFDSKAGSDVLLVGDKKIPAHKTFLMFRSPVFFAMFTHQLKENTENEVTIPDMDPDTCEKLLEFIYTDNVTNLDEVSEHLYEVADKYQLLTLKELCEESLCKNVNVENAVQYLILLVRRNADKRFFGYIVDFIALNFKKIITTPEYKALEKTHPEVSLAIMTVICSSE